MKVDREERPDVDAVYMEAVQAMTGHGGWPMTVFLDPDGRPFYGGTYFPTRPGTACRRSRACCGRSTTRGAPGATSCVEQADELTEARRAAAPTLDGADGVPGPERARRRRTAPSRAQHDAEWGGFGGRRSSRRR